MDMDMFVATSSSHDWLLDKLIPLGHIIVTSGAPGVGKSWFNNGLAIAVASGQPFLGLKTKQGAVILVDEDTPSDVLANRLIRLGKGMGIEDIKKLPIKIHSMSGVNISNADWVKRLIQEAAETHAVLIIFDSLSKVTGGDFNEDSSRDVNKATQAWNEFKSMGVTVLVAHHLNKRDGNITTDFVKMSRGSSAIIANCDTAFGIGRGQAEPTTTFNVYPQERRRKLGIRQPFGIEIQEDNLLEWAKLVRVAVTKELTTLAKDIAVIIFSNKESEIGVSFNEVKKNFGGAFADPDLRVALKELEERKVVTRRITSHNKYVYSPSEKPDNRLV
jgi:archaellum biogenesis ATPase FlaH